MLLNRKSKLSCPYLLGPTVAAGKQWRPLSRIGVKESGQTQEADQLKNLTKANEHWVGLEVPRDLESHIHC